MAVNSKHRRVELQPVSTSSEGFLGQSASVQKDCSKDSVMNRGLPSSGNGSWIDKNAAFLGATRKTIDSTNGKSQCRTFCPRADGGFHDHTRRESVMESMNGVDDAFSRRNGAPPFMLFWHHLHSRRALGRF